MLPAFVFAGILLDQTQPTAAFMRGTELHITGPKPHEIKLESGQRPLAWSPSGRFLVCVQGSSSQSLKAFLVDCNEAKPTLKAISKQCSTPQWSPDGQWLALVEPEGLVLIDPIQNSRRKLTSNAQAATWSPESRRLAVAKSQKAGSEVSIVTVANSQTTSIWSGAKVSDLAWSPDGFTLAAIILPPKGPELALIGVDGRSARSYGAVGDGMLSWSPGSRHLLTKRGSGYALLEISEKTFAPLPGGLDASPAWTGSNRLLGTFTGVPMELDILQKPYRWADSARWSSITARSDQSLVVPPVIALDSSSNGASKTLANAPKPARGQIRLQGRVSDIDPYDDQFSVDVTTAITADGREFEFPNPFLQSFAVGQKSVVVTDDAQGRLRSYDLKREGLISVIVDGLAIKSPDARTAISVFVPQWQGAVLAKATRTARAKRVVDAAGVCFDEVVVPMIHPLIGGATSHTNDFQNARVGHKHQGNDLMAPKLRPVVACFDGTITFMLRGPGKSSGNYIHLRSDDGYTALYMHINNDTPNTDDGQGGPRYAFAPGLKDGDRVVAGQLIGWCGDSGNAENTGSHVHFELHDEIGGGILNPYFSVKAAKTLREPVLPVPLPTAELLEGEAQVRGIVVQSDQTRNVLVIDVMARRDRGQMAHVEKEPKRIYAILDAKPKNDIQQLAAPTPPSQGAIVTLIGSARDANSMTVRSFMLESKR
jgi:murein DD-endopeptidase MepM/ murein hydrolase activator NlpD